jgi:drug/metabolite transporter (DMT)-like permease
MDLLTPRLNENRSDFLYALIFLTIVLTVSGQLLAKSGMHEVGAIPTQLREFPSFLMRAYTNWKVLTALLCAILASVSWIGAVSRSDVSFAYPFMGLAIVMVLVFASLFFGEKVPLSRWIGVTLVCLGIYIASRK